MDAQAPNTPTNQCAEKNVRAFLNAIFITHDQGAETPAVVYPSRNGLPGQPLASFKYGKHTHYSSAVYSLEAVEVGGSGYVKLNRRDVHWTALVVVVLDDVGETKTVYAGPNDKVGTQVTVKTPGIKPSYIVQTKPGSQQWGYILKVPLRDSGAVRTILESIKAAGYSDPNADTLIGRVFRIPGSRPAGKDHTAALVEWTGDLFDAATLLDDLGIPEVVGKPRTTASTTGAAEAPFHISDATKQAFDPGMNNDLASGLGGKWDWFDRLGSGERRKVVESALESLLGAGRGDWAAVGMPLATLPDEWAEEVFMSWSAAQPG